MPLFTPPTTDGNALAVRSEAGYALWRHFGSWAEGKTVWKDQNGDWHQALNPYQGGETHTVHDGDTTTVTGPSTNVLHLANAQVVYNGGHIYEITDAEAAELVAAGFTVDLNHALINNAAGFASTPDDASFAATDIDVTIRAALDDWTPGVVTNLISQSDIITDIGWSLAVRGDGHLGFAWSTDGTAGTHFDQHTSNPPGFENGSVHTVHATIDVDNDAGSHVVTFDVDGARLEQFTRPGTTVINNSTRPLRIGNPVLPIRGRVYNATLRSGIGGAVVASPDFQQLATGTTEFTDSAGKVWSVTAPATIG